jgi:hypothetical protein
LASYDTNGNGKLDAGDDRFEEFTVWRDDNRDGVSQAAELVGLTGHGISSISLARTLTGEGRSETENRIVATSEFVRGDGTRGTVGDVFFAYRPIEIEIVDTRPVDDSIDEEVRSAVDTAAERAAELAALRSMLSADPANVSLDFQDVQAAAGEFSRTDSALQEDEDANKHAAHWVRPALAQMLDAQSVELDVEVGAVSDTQASALHASLDSVARRRLQMVEAMAAFSAEGATDLQLMPNRRIDGRTLDLLTAVDTNRYA